MEIISHRRLLPIAVLLLLAVLVAGVGAALARRGEADANQPPSGVVPLASAEPTEPEADTDDVLTSEALDRIVSRLEDAGVETDAATVEALAADLGVGGAIRALAWSDATEGAVTPEEIAQMRTDGIGWGQLRRQLDPDGTFGLHPGIGHIMGGGHDEEPAAEGEGADAAGGGPGHGRGNGHAYGHDKDKRGGDEPAP